METTTGSQKTLPDKLKSNLHKLTGWIASGLMISMTFFWTFWATAEMYHEGWWGSWTSCSPILPKGRGVTAPPSSPAGDDAAVFDVAAAVFDVAAAVFVAARFAAARFAGGRFAAAFLVERRAAARLPTAFVLAAV